MESENEVAVEDEKHVIGITTKENINKEVENDCNNVELQTKNEVSKPIAEAEGPNSAGAGVEVEANITSSEASKNTKPAKVPYHILCSRHHKCLSSTKLFTVRTPSIMGHLY